MLNKLIEIKNVSKYFDGEGVLNNISLDIYDNEFMTILGPSGCGKTTLLRILGGFETPDSGEVYFDTKLLNDVPAYERQINTVFQRYALFPHLNVYENIAFGLRVAKTPDLEISGRVKEMLQLVNLQGFERRDVATLSGGQQQRVAIARALIMKPRVLLLDEPLGALDLKLRKEMQIELKNIREATGITFVYVTHDQEEALSMSDTVVVMNEGKILQIGSPIDVYNEPSNSFVADFIGESNIISGIMEEDYKLNIAGKSFECLDKGFLKNEAVDVVIRPEDVDVVEPAEAMLTGKVESVIFKGVHYEIIVEISDFKWMIHTTDYVEEGTHIGIHMVPDAFHVMKKEVFQ